jgi:ATP-dependent exoDNAse (exonuclease V) beta subunit
MLEELKEKISYFENCEKFTFNKNIRKYTFDDKPLISVSNIIKGLHEEFDSDYWSKKKADELGISQEEILAEWDRKAKRSTEVGSFVHKWIENYYNKVWTELPNDDEIITRINNFNKVWLTHLSKLIPICFELRVFSEKYGVVGIIDSIFTYNDNIIIIDTKTNGSIKKENRYQKMFAPFQDYDDCNFVHYSIQTSLYKLILEEHGIVSRKEYILHITNDGYEMIKCMDLSELVKEHLISIQKPVNS